jgi:hypothetical protein
MDCENETENDEKENQLEPTEIIHRTQEATVCKVCLKHKDQTKTDEEILKTLSISKKTRVDDEITKKSSANSVNDDLNFPLGHIETGHACLVKIYDNFDEYKINDMVEFIGILSQDPSLAYNYDEHSCLLETNGLPEHTGNDATEAFKLNENNVIEMDASNNHCKCTDANLVNQKKPVLSSYPPSLVPRLHCIKSFHLIHNNPLLVKLNLNSKIKQIFEIEIIK